MPWKVKKPTAADVSPDWLRPYCTLFLQKLADQPYGQILLGVAAAGLAMYGLFSLVEARYRRLRQ